MNNETQLPEREGLPLHSGVKLYSIVYIKYGIKCGVYRHKQSWLCLIFCEKWNYASGDVEHQICVSR
jgi:hypothetical protein